MRIHGTNNAIFFMRNFAPYFHPPPHSFSVKSQGKLIHFDNWRRTTSRTLSIINNLLFWQESEEEEVEVELVKVVQNESTRVEHKWSNEND